MNLNEVIKHPILSEKTYQQMAAGVYTFAVDFRTNKAEVKKVIEHIFEVKVDKVNIITVNKKPKKVGRFEGFTNRFKKAIVTLAEGHVINIFPEEVEAEKPAKEVKETKKAEISEAEKKAAEKIAAKAKEAEAKKEEPKAEAKPAETKEENK